MRIDPGNKWFIAIFSILVLGCIGFFIASIFLDFSGDVEVKKFEFENSKFRIKLRQLKSDKRCVIEVYNGKKHF